MLPMTCIPACRCERISREFFEQGDAERAAGLPVSRGCDRCSTDIASSQVLRPAPLPAGPPLWPPLVPAHVLSSRHADRYSSSCLGPLSDLVP